MPADREEIAVAQMHHQAGRLHEAVQACQRILAISPDHATAWHFLGVIAFQVGKHKAAIEYIGRALSLEPGNFEAHNNLGLVFDGLGQLDEAAASFHRAMTLNPDSAGVHHNLGRVYGKLAKRDEEIACYVRALELNPDYAEASTNLGIAYTDQGKLDKAITCFRRALELNPGLVEAHIGLGSCWLDWGEPDKAIASLRRALELQPGNAHAYNNLGSALKDQARLEEAVECYRRALALKPDFVHAHDNLVYTLLFCRGYDAATIYEEHRCWNERHAEPLSRFIKAHDSPKAVNRRLRIGYISPHFSDHVLALFLTPLFSKHDHGQFEIICYSDVARPDRITERLRSLADAWRDITGCADDQVADVVREDKIDILVDLTMHMEKNRLLVFARKPAPVQVCWLAYPGTTGLTTIGYRLTDWFLDPPGKFERHYSEESVHLADTFWCYDPETDEPAVNALPAFERHHITFGNLNNFCKVNASAVELWSRVLQLVEGSHLKLLAAEGSQRQWALDLFAKNSIGPERIEFVSPRPRPRYLELYHGIDIGLDTLPYNGHTTNLDSLWMGVPVVTIVGQTVVGRAGSSQLNNLGLPELIGQTPDHFVDIAVRLARDFDRLSNLRGVLRERMRRSPLMDAPRFARSIEIAYRSMWQKWCLERGGR